MDKDERGLFEAMLHRLQIMRQESEQQTALLRQLCQAMDGLGLEIGRLANSAETAAPGSAGRSRKSPPPQPALASLSAQAALAKDLIAKSQTSFNGSGKPSGK